MEILAILLATVVVLAFGITGCNLAANRGRIDPFYGALLGVFLGVVGLLVIVLVGHRPQPAQPLLAPR
jgi:hypothetical protein